MVYKRYINASNSSDSFSITDHNSEVSPSLHTHIVVYSKCIESDGSSWKMVQTGRAQQNTNFNIDYPKLSSWKAVPMNVLLNNYINEIRKKGT